MTSGPSTSRRRTEFHVLRVAAVERLTPDSVELTLAVPDDLRDAYRHRHGQHLTVRLDTADGELRRSYSITTAADDPTLRIGIRRVDDGRVSRRLVDRLEVGDVVDVMTPAGRFSPEIRPDEARRWLLVAAGSGITPILSIARTVLDQEPASTVTLVYGNRTLDSIMFRRDLDDLKSLHLDRLAIVNVLSRERLGSELLHGRIDAERLRSISAVVSGSTTPDVACLCGPGDMPVQLRESLLADGMPSTDVHMELFTPAGDDGGRRAADGAGPAAGDGPTSTDGEARPIVATATMVVNGREREVAVHEGERLLQAARREGIDAPWACRGGVCATCRAHVSGGRVEMVANQALEPDEVAAGYALTCQSLPLDPTLRVDWDRP